jgi:peptidyl-prolyl cis-trans isomerase C
MRSFTLAAVCVLAAAIATAGAGCSKKGGKGGNADSLAAAKAAAEHILVRVNGTDVSELEMQRQANMLLGQLRQYADSAQVASMMPTIRQQALDNAINRILLEEAVEKLGITADKAKVEERIETYRKNFVSEEAFQESLAKQGLAPEKLFREVEIAMRAEELFRRSTAGVAPASDAEMRDFYDKNPDRFQQPERVRASHILIKTEKTDSDAVKAEKRAKIEGILASLKKGADFAELARTNSECPSKEQGGDLGYFERGSMVPEFEAAAFTLKTGQLSGVVETQFGYHVIKVTDHAKQAATPFEQTKQQLSAYLSDQKRNAAIATYFDSLRTAAKIEYLDSTLVR